MERLPESAEAAAEEQEAAEVVRPEDQVLPLTYFGRMRGALLLIALAGLALFFAPWVELRMPEQSVRSGFDLARGRAGWLWGGAAAWLVLLPLLWTRRSLRRLRGVRFVCALFAGMTLMETTMLIVVPQRAQHHLPLEIVWRWGIFASALAGAAGVACALFLGGKSEHAAPALTDVVSRDPAETSSGQTLH